MKPRTRNILAIVLIAVIVIGGGFAVYFLFINDPDTSWRIRHISAQNVVVHGEYSNSRLYIHANGTFEIEIIQSVGDDDLIVFTGVGTHTGVGTSTTFTFVDEYTARGSLTPQIRQTSRSRAVFESPWGVDFTFGR